MSKNSCEEIHEENQEKILKIYKKSKNNREEMQTLRHVSKFI